MQECDLAGETDLPEIVRDQQHAHALAAHGADQGLDRRRRGRIENRRRPLAEDQDLGAGRQRAGDCQQLLLASREHARRHVRQMRQSRALQRGKGALPPLRAGDTGHSQRVFDIGQRRPAQRHRPLKHKADPGRATPLGGAAGPGQPPRRGHDEAGQHTRKQTLTRAVGPMSASMPPPPISMSMPSRMRRPPRSNTSPSPRIGKIRRTRCATPAAPAGDTLEPASFLRHRPSGLPSCAVRHRQHGIDQDGRTRPQDQAEAQGQAPGPLFRRSRCNRRHHRGDGVPMLPPTMMTAPTSAYWAAEARQAGWSADQGCSKMSAPPGNRPSAQRAEPPGRPRRKSSIGRRPSDVDDRADAACSGPAHPWLLQQQAGNHVGPVFEDREEITSPTTNSGNPIEGIQQQDQHVHLPAQGVRTAPGRRSGMPASGRRRAAAQELMQDMKVYLANWCSRSTTKRFKGGRTSPARARGW